MHDWRLLTHMFVCACVLLQQLTIVVNFNSFSAVYAMQCFFGTFFFVVENSISLFLDHFSLVAFLLI